MDTGLAPEGNCQATAIGRTGRTGVAALVMTEVGCGRDEDENTLATLVKGCKMRVTSTLANCVRFFIFGSCGRHYYTSDR